VSVVPKAHKAQAPTITTSGKPARHEMSPADLEAFLDGFLPYQLHRDDIAGAVVVIVKDGKILFAKGYGYADVEKRVPVIPEQTMFRQGSVGKLFTWIAVMQLVEQGKLDLDRDLNDYLDFSVPHTFGKPTTLRNLMTHTPGFEEEVKDSQVDKPSDLPSLRSFLLGHLPRQIYPPGTIPAYSNTGANLAGYIVERVSGQPYADYVREHIFQPLDMLRTTTSQPPDIPGAFMSKPYASASEKEKPFELLSPQPGPDGAMAGTAIDMAHFMIAHLQNGEYQGKRILREATARLMHTRQFTTDPVLPGMALGFIGQDRNGLQIVGHDGDTNYHHSDLHLIPSANFGYFVSYNSTGSGEDARTTLWQAFLDRYFPADSSSANRAASGTEDSAVVTGVYLSSRREQSTFLLPLWLIFAEATVSANPDGTIEVDQLKDPNDKPKKWQAAGNLIFEEVNGADKIVFRRDQGGRLQMMTSDPTAIYQRAPWRWDKRIVRLLVGAILIVFVLTLVFWPIAVILRRHYRQQLAIAQAQRGFRTFARIISSAAFLSMLTFAVLMAMGVADFTLFSSKLDVWLRLVQLLTALTALGTVAVFYKGILLWRASDVSIWAKLYGAVFLIACAGFVWVVFSFNILRPSLSY
jgi:CubicO group peptidase (beta-lactamase class C family)